MPRLISQAQIQPNNCFVLKLDWIDGASGGDDYDHDDDAHYGDTPGVGLHKDLVKQARRQVLDWVHGIKLYAKSNDNE